MTVVVPAVLERDTSRFQNGSSSEFAPNEDKGFVQKSPFLEILNQGGHGAIRHLSHSAMGHDVRVAVPVSRLSERPSRNTLVPRERPAR